MFSKVLVANRGEIACRVIRTCKCLGIETVAVYSDADANAPHVRLAHRGVRIGEAPVRSSYLDVASLVRAVRDTGAEAVHPGYGLLSENADFARAIADAGAIFIGPPPAALERFGDKLLARALARELGISPPPGSAVAIHVDDEASLRSTAEALGYPVLLKAAAGGGGIGMQIVTMPDALSKAARTCASRAEAAFADGRVYLERYLERPRHIEVQVVRDASGRCIALGNRDCSVQRRHQKVIEEAPSPASFFTGSDGQVRLEKSFRDACRLLDAAGYLGVGTVEFIADQSGTLFFLEVNARLQVEHPVTEAVTGLDLVELQLRIASGENPLAELGEITPHGHAVEARLYAEDPDKGFVPQPGHLDRVDFPVELEGVRIDTGIESNMDVTPHYDPLLAKLIGSGSTREEAIARLDAALAATRIELVGPKGPRKTNLAFLRRLLQSQRFQSGDYDTNLTAQVIAEPARSSA